MTAKHDDQPAADRLSITASNFGPIARATVQLRPLTVFAGPSNTGKSRLAMLLYALHRFADRQAASSGNIDLDECWAEFSSAAKSTTRKKSPQPLAEQIAAFWSSKKRLASLQRHFASSGKALGEEICRCYGLSNPAELASGESANGRALNIRIKQGTALLQEITLNKTALAVSAPSSSILQGQIIAAAGSAERTAGQTAKSPANAHIRKLAFANFPDELNKIKYGALQGRAWYLPANRTGIMHARDVLLGSLIERSARASAQTQLLSGITADFLEQIFYADRLAPGNRGSNGSARPGKMAKIAKLIEDRIIGGKIIIEHSAILNQPIIKYQPKGWKKNTLPLPSTSAMVTELAALVIFLRYGIEAGDVLIFEEPEAGLHPAKQPELMQVLAAIVNAGVKVVMTTHSDWIMEKLANVILNGDKPDKLPAQNRFALGEDQVGAWLFKNKGQKGTIVAEIPFEEHGLYETGYREVSSQLYNEWRPLSERRQEKSVQAFSK